MTRDWPDIIRAAASSELGIVALVVMIVGGIAYTFFRRDSTKVRLTAFGFIVLGAGLLIAAVLHARDHFGSSERSDAPSARSESHPSSPPVARAVLPNLLDYVAIWEGIPRLTAAGFRQIEIDLTRDENYVIKGRVAPPGIIIGVSGSEGSLNAGEAYPVDTKIRLRLQSDPSWNRPGRVYSDPQEVRDLMEFVQHDELEKEMAHKGKGFLNR